MKYIEFNEAVQQAISVLCDVALKAKGLEIQGLVNFINSSVKDGEINESKAPEAVTE